MFLKRIEIKGFEGIGHVPGVILEDLKEFNLVIGPNNSGKSSIFRALHWTANAIALSPDGSRIIPTTMGNRKDRFFKGVFDKPITLSMVLEIDLLFLHKDEDWVRHSIREKQIAEGIPQYGNEQFRYIYENEFRFDVEIVNTPIVNPLVYDLATKNWSLMHNVPGCHAMLKDACMVVKRWAQHTKFFAANRRPGRDNANTSEMEDGRGLINELYKISRDASEFHRLNSTIVEQINRLVVGTQSSEVRSIAVDGETENSRFIKVLFDGHDEFIKLEYLGSGISELVLVFAHMHLDRDKKMMYFLEEPEAHMHPSLLRRFIESLRDNRDIQLFVNTHSNILLERTTADTSKNTSIYRVIPNQNTGASVIPCNDYVNQMDVLDELGVRGASLLQSDCVVWVEGPTDRLYIRAWLEQYAESKKCRLLEGSDFSFIMYGGSLLSYYAYDEDRADVDDLIKLVRVCRYSAVLMDRDVPPEDELNEDDRKKFKEFQEKILSEARTDPRLFASKTIGREIENDVPWDLLKTAIHKQLRGLKLEKFPDCLRGTARFHQELAEEMGVPSISDRIVKYKVKIAERVINQMKSRTIHDFPPYIIDLFNHIKNARDPGGNTGKC